MSYRAPSPLGKRFQDEFLDKRRQVSGRAGSAPDPVRLARLNALIEGYERREREIRETQPNVAALADKLRDMQPGWAVSEDCDVTVLMVQDALKKLGLDLCER